VAYIFLDESGDLGFNFTKKKTSKFFVVTFLFIQKKRLVERIVKKIFKTFSKKQIKAHHGVLHCYKEHPRIRKKVLTSLNDIKSVSILAIYLNKKKVYTKLQNEKPVLYNYVTNILLDRLYTKKLIPINEPIYLIASRRETNKFLNANFKKYLKHKIKSDHHLDIQIDIKPLADEKCLQVVDFASWAIFRSKERQDGSYRNLIKKRIIEESGLFQ